MEIVDKFLDSYFQSNIIIGAEPSLYLNPFDAKREFEKVAQENLGEQYTMSLFSKAKKQKTDQNLRAES